MANALEVEEDGDRLREDAVLAALGRFVGPVGESVRVHFSRYRVAEETARPEGGGLWGEASGSAGAAIVGRKRGSFFGCSAVATLLGLVAPAGCGVLRGVGVGFE